MKHLNVILLLSFIPFFLSGQCDQTASIPPNGTVNVFGMQITTVSTGSVDDFSNEHESCGLYKTDPGSLWVGITGGFTVDFTFGQPVNDLIIVLNSTGHTFNENFNFITNGGPVTITEANSSCFSTIVGNEILSGFGSVPGITLGGGGWFQISAAGDFTSLMLSGSGGHSGSLFGICEASLNNCEAKAGDISANTPVCPNSIIQFGVDLFNDSPDFTELLLVVDSDGIITEILNTSTGTLTSSMCERFTIVSYNYLTMGGSIVPVVGDHISILDCSSECCELDSLTVEFADISQPGFQNAPDDLFLDCIDDLPALIDQVWVDNCDFIGTVSGVESDNFDDCNGGTIIRTWTYVDNCGNSGEHIQTITIAPLISPSFINAPANDTVDCAEIPQNFPDLIYTNNMEGSCLIKDSVAATIIEDYDLCGGTIQVQWSTTDVCNNPIDHSQLINVRASTQASFINLPQDITVSCDSIPTETPRLTYTNSDTSCLIEGSVEPIVTRDVDHNGGTILYSWEFTDVCSRTITYPHLITVESMSDYSDVVISVCDNNTDGVLLWDSLQLQSYLNINQTEQITFYTSFSDAEQQANAILLPYSNDMSFVDSLYAMITKQSGCTELILVEFNINPKPEIIVDVTNEKCFGDNDGFVEIINFNSEANYSMNGTEIDSAFQIGLEAGDYQIIIENQNECRDTTGFSISPGLIIEVDSFSWTCNDNGTGHDPTDDYYLVEFELSNSLGLLTGYTLTDQNQNNLGTFSYENLVSINILANDEVVELLFTDNENQCTHSQTIGPLTTCSEGCTLIIDELNSTCQDNGTPFDPTDDFYLITLDVNAEYGSSTNSYNVAINGVQSHTFTYGQVVNFMLPADGSSVTLTLSDTEDQACFLTEQIGPLETCSDDCEIYPDYINVICDNNGTVVNNDDDVFYFDLVVSGLNVSTTYSIIELSYTGSYDVLTEFGPFNISEGSIQLTIVNADSSCTSTIEIAPPMACSDCNQTISLNNPDEITCAMPEIELLVTASETATYQWSGPNGFSSTFDTINVDLPGWYEVIISFSDGCSQIDSIEVISNNDIPLVVLGPDLLLNCAITQGTLDASNSIYKTGAQFAWSDESGNIISTDLVTTVDQAGKYFFVIEDPLTGCISQVGEIEVIVDYNEPLVEIFADPDSIINCYWETIELSYLEEPNVIYEWIINNQNIVSNVVTVTNAATVTLISLDTISGCENSSEFNVDELKEYPFIILEQDDIDCESGEVCIDGSNSPFASDLLFEWYDGNGNLIAQNQEILCVDVSGDYTLELTDEINGCENSESISVMTPIIPSISLPETVTINPDMDGQIKVNIDHPLDEISEIIWSPSDALLCNDCVNNQIINPIDNLIVEVEVISISGCSTIASTIVIIEKIVEVYIPNVINFNSSRGNSHFTLYGNDQVEWIEKFSIYDRWGNLVFNVEDIEPNNSQLGWDGTFNGKAGQQGVYVYKFNVLVSSGKIEEYIGTLTLLK